jgi:hypothetical protein
MRSTFIVSLFTLLCLHVCSRAASLIVPAETGYLEPDMGGAHISRQGGIVNWIDHETQIRWYGNFKNVGQLKVHLQVRGRNEGSVTLQLQVGSEEKRRVVNIENNKEAEVDFGAFEITEPGYLPIALKRIPSQDADATALDIIQLELDGESVDKAHFNLKPRRNAASVHLVYPVMENVKVAAFYCEMTALEDPVHSYYMACGWHRGYFGMQVNSPTERRIIFSVWDRGNEPTDPNKVDEMDRVRLVEKGDGVFTGRFGNEGTGGHSHLKYPWKTGSLQKFLVTATPINDTHTRFTGYYHHPDSLEWMLISSWDTPGEGGYMRGLYSFSENFVGSNGHLIRKALYGNQWIVQPNGNWIELTSAKFSHDPTGKEDRLDRFMGLEKGQFFLSHGGFVDGFTDYGAVFQRPATGNQPSGTPFTPIK